MALRHSVCGCLCGQTFRRAARGPGTGGERVGSKRVALHASYLGAASPKRYFCHTRTQSTSVFSSSGVCEVVPDVQPPMYMSNSRNCGWLVESYTGAECR